MDFFSIPLPGALLTWLLMGEAGSLVLGGRYTKLAGAQAWAAFLFASYLFGHLVFLLGSWLDEFYDWARRYRETAVREVREETGVWARIVSDLRDVSWSAGGSVVATRFFLMQAVGRGLQKDKDRRHEWLALPDAIARASHIETRELLQIAEQHHSSAAGKSTTAHSSPSVSS